jgi:two-component system phosphate regulon sensor histidine kinase PhoR
LAGQRLADKVDMPALLALFGPERQMAEVRLPDGRTAQACTAQVVTEFGEFVGWTAVLRDITVLKELDQMKNDFVNTVSHDLKNPINTITLAAELLEKLGPLTEKQSDMHSRILQTALYMNELVTDLLDLGKIQAGLDLQMTPFDFRALVEDVLFAVAGAAEQKGQQIETQLPDQLTLEADERRLKQVLLNLVGNAIKYTPPQGNIRLAVTVEKAQVVVAVQDDGIGIPAADLPHLFDKFYRVQNESTRGIKGTGLGLAIARSIVEAHHGRIWVESTPGEGSTFSLALPLVHHG